MLEEGSTAPNFSLPNQDEQLINLHDLRGKYVLIWFYPRASTPGCTIEGCGFRDKSEEFNTKNVVILGLSNDAPAKNKRFKDKKSFPYDLLCDQDNKMALDYGAADDADAKSLKRISYLIDPEGIIAKAYPKVNPLGHPQQVLDDLATLQS